MISCAAGALHLFSAWTFPIDEAVRWCAVGVLLCASGLTLYAGASGQDIRGASGNASGVAVLLRLAERLATTPLEEADVWLVATGSKESWLQGMHHLLATNELDRRHTYFLNIDHVGGGRLCYIEAEGMLRPFKADAEMLAAAQEVAEEHGAVPQQFPLWRDGCSSCRWRAASRHWASWDSTSVACRPISAGIRTNWSMSRP